MDSSKEPPTLLTLPRELRNDIVQCAIPKREHYEVRHPLKKHGMLSVISPLAQVCQILRAETLCHFYEANFFQVSICDAESWRHIRKWFRAIDKDHVRLIPDLLICDVPSLNRKYDWLKDRPDGLTKESWRVPETWMKEDAIPSSITSNKVDFCGKWLEWLHAVLDGRELWDLFKNSIEHDLHYAKRDFDYRYMMHNPDDADLVFSREDLLIQEIGSMVDMCPSCSEDVKWCASGDNKIVDNKELHAMYREKLDPLYVLVRMSLSDILVRKEARSSTEGHNTDAHVLEGTELRYTRTLWHERAQDERWDERAMILGLLDDTSDENEEELDEDFVLAWSDKIDRGIRYYGKIAYFERKLKFVLVR